MTIIGHTLGFPRIGLHRELKYALEYYWNGKIKENKLLEIGRTLRRRHWKQQKDSGIDWIPVGDFAWYDHVLTTSMMLNNIPNRHRTDQENDNLTTLFRISRGYSFNKKLIPPAEMKKWFNTNYHYIVPEFVHTQEFRLNWMQLFDEIDEALSLKYTVKPILLGPISYLWLGKVKGKKFDRLSLLPNLLSVYQEILDILSSKNIDWVQIDEPILVLELPFQWLEAYLSTYEQLHGTVKLLLTTYFDNIYHQLDIITQLKIDGLHADLVSNSDNIPLLHAQLPKHWVLSAGVINGRNIWKTNLHNWFKKLSPLVGERKLWIGSSCSFLHSPIDLNIETKLKKHIKEWFAFAVQKCCEIKMLCTALNAKYADDSTHEDILSEYYVSNNLRSDSSAIYNIQVKKRLEDINEIAHSRCAPYATRVTLQHKKLNLPLLPTTTIGSFPQTKEIRKLRFRFKNNQINKEDYHLNIKNYIKEIIIEQEKLGLDVLVHGEPERNDMVEYFGENLNGFIFTQNGWVQSYGSRCVKPPVIIGDISRSKPITTEWINYAQSLTKKPIKGILTGPVTIMYWSFPREDIQRKTIALQLALSIRDEVIDLEKFGIGIIQIDEPALREGLPLKHSDQKKYLEWAIDVFRITVSSVKDETQIHTHMCYSEFSDIMDSILALDADVISIEASRSDEKMLQSIQYVTKNLNEIGPGIYDIHSPNAPTQNELITKINQLLKYIPKQRLWINPDCGLKTRSWPETKQSLSNMVSAAKLLRKQSYLP
ncbi:5-methyltetrahydropteroyltriglutamate--homocysteine S-methyltransferase [Blochmannia endosymbiont of Camponotus sp. C-046]|uniref:5-methyltetrahydropteroyltriglutamate-- homocysteine S-methyltransferase n=1 Tax=Blochmannia endosymbiont of Camponotus sp. C-046 TaxID=2945589 RepID=UPI002023BE71|nr:5-methyltetrahydropteroyltriglutamate--homocysteine S-methyltransferase [Blochmannia endosymbiont of Camponotus sp. C-046]URJ28699.1 5-methyltetrahydropteroyltriglutamate--homocysteine S-methyltransferase [Blochmannia endosymbiont of Camponotus sp. C-046]